MAPTNESGSSGVSMKVSEAIAQLGIVPDALPGDLVIVQFTNKRPIHHRYSEVADREVSRDLYLATGTYAPGSVSKYEGRTGENVTSVLWLVLDCDLKDYLNTPTADLHTWSDGDLMVAARALAGDLREVLELISVPCHRIDYTGYGICAYIVLDDNTPDDLETLRSLNAGLVDQVNSTWGSTLADPSVHDAGTRVTRLVPGPNTKHPAFPRQSKTLWTNPGKSSIADLQKVITARTRTTVARAIPRTGQSLPDEIQQNIVAAITPHWTEGKRHGLALAVSGILAKSGAPEEEARAIVEFAANNAGDPELGDRIKAVETSYQRARNGLQTRGLFGLRDWLPIDAAEYIDRELEKVRGATASITFTVAEGAKPLHSVSSGFDGDNTFEVLDIPDSARFGLIGEYIELVRPTTESSDGFHLGTILTIVGAMIGRRVSVEYAGALYPNLYTLLVGTSGQSRKDTAIKKGITFLNTKSIQGTTIRQSGVSMLTDIASAEGMIKALAEKPNTLMYISEFARMMKNSTRTGTAIIPLLIEAFDTPAVLSNSSLSNPLRAEYPYTSILSATQPRILEGLMSDDHVHSGFINRWLIIPGKSIQPLPIPPALDLLALESLFEQVHVMIHEKADGTRMMFSPDGEAYWNEWYVSNWNRKRSEDAASMAVRHPGLAMKIALIYAVLDGCPALTADHLSRAVAIIDWMWVHVERMLPGWGGTLQGRIEAKVTQFLTDRGPVKRAVITQYCKSRTWSTDDLNRAVEAMVRGGAIVVDPSGVVALNMLNS